MENKQFALITVNNKKGLLHLARELAGLGFEIVASRMTSKFLKKFGLEVIDVEDITGYPPVMGKQGIKLIHPKIFGGILGDKTKKSHKKDAEKFGINFFDVVVCNFYPFEKIIARKKFSHERAIRNIDIGGPAMVRCAAKNYKNVTILVDPCDYKKALEELKIAGETSAETKKYLALKAFRYDCEYDKKVIRYLSLKFRD